MHPIMNILMKITAVDEVYTEKALLEFKGLLDKFSEIRSLQKKENDVLKVIAASMPGQRLVIPEELSIDFRSPHDGTTLLNVAASYLQVGVMRLLIKAGADINSQDNEGCTALINMIYHEHCSVQAISFLIDENANLNVLNNEGMTALNVAINESKLDIAQFLLKQNALGNAEDIWRLIKKRDLRNPDEMNLIILFYQQQKLLKLDDSVSKIFKLNADTYRILEECVEKLIHIEKFCILTDDNRRQLFNSLDQNIKSSDNLPNKAPHEIIETITNYSYPVLSGLAFFNAKKIDIALGKSCFALLKKRKEDSAIDDPFQLSQKNHLLSRKN